jgi:type IV pilus assembly protein PilX
MNRPVRASRGFSLIVVLMLLLVVSVLGLAAAQNALVGERITRNDRDTEVAFQAAEAALLDAERDVLGPNDHAAQRLCLFDGRDVSAFVVDCAGTGARLGLCAAAPVGDPPVWTRIDFAPDANRSVAYGRFTGQVYATGAGGLSVRAPHYVVEALRSRGSGPQGVLHSASAGAATHVFRVTAIGYGPREETRVLLQTTLAKPSASPGCADASSPST